MKERIPQALTPEQWEMFSAGQMEPFLTPALEGGYGYFFAAQILMRHPQGFRAADLGVLLSAVHALTLAAQKDVPNDPTVLHGMAQKLFELTQRVAALLPQHFVAKSSADGETHELHALYEKGAELPLFGDPLPPDDDADGDEWKHGLRLT